MGVREMLIGVLCFSLGSRLRERGKWVLCFSLGSRLRGNDEGVRGGSLAFAKGVNGVLCFSLGSRLRGKDGGRRVKRPGRYLVRSLSVNGLEFAPPPRSGRGEFDRVVDRACYQQSQTETKYAPVTGPRRGGLPDSRQKSSACVVRRQDVGHAPRTR